MTRNLIALALALGALWINQGCQPSHNMSMDYLLADTKAEIEAFFSDRGEMPKTVGDLSQRWRGIAASYPGFDKSSISWRVVKPRGYDRGNPFAALVRIEARSKETGRIVAYFEEDLELALKNSSWTIRYRKSSPDKEVVIDEPYNVGCCLALAMLESQLSTGKWERCETLVARKDRWLDKKLVITKTVRSFRSRVVDRNGKPMLILSCGIDGNDYIFDPSGFSAGKPPTVVKTP